MRFPSLSVFALLVVLALFWLMAWMIAPPEAPLLERREVPGVELVKVEEDQPESEDLAAPDAPPPPPPPAPPALAQPDLPTVSVPAPSSVAVGEVAVPLSLSGSLSVTGQGFGGFAGGSGSGGGGGQGYGTGKGFKGKELVPLSTARPQMPEWACKRKIKGWVEVVFTVLPSGRVQDVKIVDAEPKGVYEAAAIQSVSNWIYEAYPKAREVKQRVPMDPADCAYNYQ